MPQRDNTIILEDVRLIFRNFTGREGMYNREGDRNFAVELPADVANEMAANGWNVKLRKRREDEEEDEPQPYISVAVKFGSRPPTIKMIGSKSGRSTLLDEEAVEILDYVDILQADLIIRPYDWTANGNSGRKAYLQSLYVTIIEDPLELKYGDLAIASVEGPMMERTEPLRVESSRVGSRREIER